MHWTDAKPHTWDNRRDGQDMSDEQVANKVRMLMRSDWDHEHVCCLVRDRIASLARERDQLREFVEQVARGESAGTNVRPAANDLLSRITQERSSNVFAKASPEMHDPECAKLAEYFMADEHKHVAKRAAELADHIQQAIEDWFYTVKHEERTPD